MTGTELGKMVKSPNVPPFGNGVQGRSRFAVEVLIFVDVFKLYYDWISNTPNGFRNDKTNKRLISPQGRDRSRVRFLATPGAPQ